MNLTDLLVHEMVVDWGSNRRVITTRNGDAITLLHTWRSEYLP